VTPRYTQPSYTDSQKTRKTPKNMSGRFLSRITINHISFTYIFDFPAKKKMFSGNYLVLLRDEGKYFSDRDIFFSTTRIMCAAAVCTCVLWTYLKRLSGATRFRFLVKPDRFFSSYFSVIQKKDKFIYFFEILKSFFFKNFIRARAKKGKF
jgi:hypothetical protein